ncbi:hypothetical protein M8411_15180, partial [Staphylococcus aureus]|nr:hypothetical protein [Staphylococcus aureus]
NFEFVNRAFGGLNTTVEDDSDDEMEVERSQDDSEANNEEEAIQDISLAINRGSNRQRHPTFAVGEDIGLQTPDDSTSDNENDDDSEDEDEDDDEDDESDEVIGLNDDDSESDAAERLFQSYGFERNKREDVETDVPCSSHTRVYRGHCNVKTVKDAN